MKDPIAAIETAIVSRLVYHNTDEAKDLAWPFRCKYIDSYGGQFDGPEEIAQAAQKTPGLWVTYDGETGELENGFHTARINYVVFALAKSYNPAQLRLGGAGAAGLYQLIEAVRSALVNQTLGSDMTPLELQNITPLWRGGPQGGGISLAAMRFSTVVRVETPSHFELDGLVCKTPLYVTAWEIKGLPIATDKRRVKNEHPVSETAGDGPSAEP